MYKPKRMVFAKMWELPNIGNHIINNKYGINCKKSKRHSNWVGLSFITCIMDFTSVG
jgi:hypothetical protein